MSVPSIPDDAQDLLSLLTDEAVLFIVVGAHALARSGVARATGDLDIFIQPTRENAERLWRALLRFGAPLAAHQVHVDDFARPGVVYQLGLPPMRIDVLTSISGVSFDEAHRGRVRGSVGELMIDFLGSAELLQNKRATGRAKDLADVTMLEEALRKR